MKNVAIEMSNFKMLLTMRSDHLFGGGNGNNRNLDVTNDAPPFRC